MCTSAFVAAASLVLPDESLCVGLPFLLLTFYGLGLSAVFSIKSKPLPHFTTMSFPSWRAQWVKLWCAVQDAEKRSSQLHVPSWCWQYSWVCFTSERYLVFFSYFLSDFVLKKAWKPASDRAEAQKRASHDLKDGNSVKITWDLCVFQTPLFSQPHKTFGVWRIVWIFFFHPWTREQATTVSTLEIYSY